MSNSSLTCRLWGDKLEPAQVQKNGFALARADPTLQADPAGGWCMG